MNTALFQGKYRIKSNRLPDYDFSSEGAYFVTICTKNRENYFGEIIDSEMIFSEMGIVAKKCRSEILNQFPNTFLDEFVIMPNHIHGIVFLNYGDAVNYDVIYRDAIYRDAINRVSMNMIGAVDGNVGGITGLKNPMIHNKSLGAIVRWFKGRCSFEIRKSVDKSFQRQSNYHTTIIQNDLALINVRNYIIQNPTKWEFDSDNLGINAQ